MPLSIVYILLSVVASAIGQVLLKQGMTSTGGVTLSWDRLPQTLWQVFTNPWVMVGLIIYVGGTVFWLAALSHVNLSYAYPFAALSYLVMLLASWLVFKENISNLRLFGAAVICLGVFLISRT